MRESIYLVLYSEHDDPHRHDDKYDEQDGQNDDETPIFSHVRYPYDGVYIYFWVKLLYPCDIFLFMDIRDVYANKHLFEEFAFRNLMYDEMLLTPVLGAPETVRDVVIENLVAHTYFMLTGFDKEGIPAMGEVGGVCLDHSDYEGRMLVIDPFSGSSSAYGLTVLMKSGKSMEEVSDEIEARIGYPPERKGPIIRVDGTQHAQHYDFRTIVAPQDISDCLYPDKVAMWLAAGRKLKNCGRQLSRQHYNFMIPYSRPVIDALRGVNIHSVQECIDAVASEYEHLFPEGFVAGFHIEYYPTQLVMRPLLIESFWDIYKDSIPYDKTESGINNIGLMQADNNINLWEQPLLTTNWTGLPEN
jgi:hypothetical protein